MTAQRSIRAELARRQPRPSGCLVPRWRRLGCARRGESGWIDASVEWQLTLLRKKEPEALMSSQRTTTTFWPLRICLATIEARRPRRWPLPSMVTGAVEKVAIWNTLRGVGVESEHEENSKESRAASEARRVRRN